VITTDVHKIFDSKPGNVTLNQVLNIYTSLLNGDISREKAGEWGRVNEQLIKDAKSKIIPANDEDLTRELIHYLHTIDIQNPDASHGYALSNKKIVQYLRNKGIHFC
jgi:hypothetical protein